MNTTVPKEYDFYRVGKRIYRVFGPHLVDGRIPGLIRYWSTAAGRQWRKPPVYGGEEEHPDSIALYDHMRLERHPSFRILLAMYSPSELDEVFDAVEALPAATARDPRLRIVASDFERIFDRRMMGVGGSRLLGNERATSDFDLLLVGCESWRDVRDALDQFRGYEPRDDALPVSRLVNLCGGLVPELPLRAFAWLRKGALDVDLHMTDRPTRELISTFDRRLQYGPSITRRLAIVGDRQRHLYPSRHKALDLDLSREVEVIGLDHVLHLILDGDEIEARCRMASDGLLVEKVLSVDLR